MAFDVPAPLGYPPGTPPVPRFLKSVESVSQGSTAAEWLGDIHQTISSDDDNAENAETAEGSTAAEWLACGDIHQTISCDENADGSIAAEWLVCTETCRTASPDDENAEGSMAAEWFACREIRQTVFSDDDNAENGENAENAENAENVENTETAEQDACGFVPPPGLSKPTPAAAVLSSASMETWSANLLTSALDLRPLRPEPETDPENLRRLNDIETLKATVAQLQEEIQVRSNSARPQAAMPVQMSQMPSQTFRSDMEAAFAMQAMRERAGELGRGGWPGHVWPKLVTFPPAVATVASYPSFQESGLACFSSQPQPYAASQRLETVESMTAVTQKRLSGAGIGMPVASAHVDFAAHVARSTGGGTTAPANPAVTSQQRIEIVGEFAIQKAINRELLAASAREDESCALQVLSVASKYVDQMNGVNLSTAIHRIARACQRFKHTADEVKKAPGFMSMVMAAERMVLQELEHRDMRMPVKCCTIIAWSCASLRVFRNSLFSALARLATVNIEQCQSYEMTNIMWAFGELCKSRRQLGKDLKDELHKLLEATCRIFALRPFGWKLQVLMSALVSLTILPWKPCSQSLFTDIAMEVARRQQELQNEKLKPLEMAFGELRAKKPQVFNELALALQDFPEFLAKNMLGNKRSMRSCRFGEPQSQAA